MKAPMTMMMTWAKSVQITAVSPPETKENYAMQSDVKHVG